jgi:hypothetical protein
MSDYADLDTVRHRLDIEGDEEDANLAVLNAALSRAFEAKVGRRFGDGEPDVARIVCVERGYQRLILPWPIRAVTTIAEDPVWEGSVWTGGTVLEIADYRLMTGTNGLAYQVERIDGGGWFGPYLITGQWADTPDGSVPDDVVEAVTVLVVGSFRKDQTGDGETSGPEGFSFKPANPWNDERVKAAIATHAIRRPTI